MSIYLYLSSPSIANWKIEQNNTSFSIYLINMQLNIYSCINQSYFFFVISFHAFSSCFSWSISLFSSDFSQLLKYYCCRTSLISHIYKYIFQGHRLPLVVFMADLGSRAVLFLWSNLSVLSLMVSTVGIIFKKKIVFTSKIYWY